MKQLRYSEGSATPGGSIGKDVRKKDQEALLETGVPKLQGSGNLLSPALRHLLA